MNNRVFGRTIGISIALLAVLFVASHAAIASEPLRALIVDGQNNHAWKQTTPVIKDILESSGRFAVDVATSPPAGGDMESFQPDLAPYHVVVSNYNGEPWGKALNHSLDTYVRSGRGFVSVHAANNAFPDWPRYNRMIGLGGWGERDEGSGPYLRLREGKWVKDASPGPGGGHGTFHAFDINVRTPLHPITFGMLHTWRHAPDELYDRLRGPAEALTVLASAESTTETKGSGEHEPLIMTIDYGRGRVFHTALGHAPTSMSKSPGFIATLQRGTEWAATGRVTIELPSELRAPSHDGWKPLFNGRDFDGWVQRNGSATYRVDNGVVVGTTNEGSPNSFLCTAEQYGDFELVFEVFLVHNELNSGVQVRSRSTSGYNHYRVHGPQVEIAANGTAGFIYGEALGTGWLTEPKPTHTRFGNGRWNCFRIVAKGQRIRTFVNGEPVADLNDDKTDHDRGFIGLQVHGIRSGTGPFEVRWRNLYLRRLD